MNMESNTEANKQNEDVERNETIIDIPTEVSDSFKDCNRPIAQPPSFPDEIFSTSPVNHIMDLQSVPRSSTPFSWSSVVTGDFIIAEKQMKNIRIIQPNDELKSDIFGNKYFSKHSLTRADCINDRRIIRRKVRTNDRDCNGITIDVSEDLSDSEQEWEPIYSKKRPQYKKYNKYSDFVKEYPECEINNVLEDSEKESSFFERSRNFYDNETIHNGIDECLIIKLLNEGLELSSHYVDKFKDKAPGVLNREPFYAEDCSDKEMESKLKANPNMYLICSIDIRTPHHAYCVPVKSKTNTKIDICGRSKAGQCFTEDEVLVKILNVDKNKHGHSKRYGEVLKRVQQHRYRNVQHPVFVCILDDQAGNLMVPLCKALPKIHIRDSRVKKNFPKFRKNYVDIYQYNAEEKTLHFRDTIPISDDSRETFVFIVVFLRWSRRYIYPLGAVIDVLSSGSRSMNANLRALDAMYSVPFLYGKQTVEHVNCIMSEGHQQSITDSQRINLTNLRAFTIDSDHATSLDDALSIETKKECHRVGVHITDVTILVKKNDPTDQEARKRIETFYSNIGKPRRLLPEPISETVCSLIPNEPRQCLSVFFDFDSNGEVIEPPVINSTMIQSHYKLSYSNVQRILECEETDLDQIIASDLRCLSVLATKLRKGRLGNAMHAARSKDFDEFEARYLVEEFMILANKYVTKRLLEVFPNQVPLICQDPPSESNIEAWWVEHQSLVHILLSLQDRTLMEDKAPSLTEALVDKAGQVIHVSEAFLRTIRVQDKIDLRRACKMLKSDELHPLQCNALHQWYSIQNKVTYKCSSQQRKESADSECFHINGCPYINFTSPLRRYSDMVVHRLVHCMLQNENCCYTQEEIKQLCSYLNKEAGKDALYEEKCRSLIIAESLRQLPKHCTCIIVDVSEEGITFVAPDIDEIQTLFISFKLLNMVSNPEVTENRGNKHMFTLKWKRRLYARQYSEPLLPFTEYTTIKSIDPYKDLGFIPVKDWATALIKLVNNQHEEEIAKVFKDLSKSVSRRHEISVNDMSIDDSDDKDNDSVPSNASYSADENKADYNVNGKKKGSPRASFSNDVSTEAFHNKEKEAVAPYASFSMTFSCGQTIDVQISSGFRRGMLTSYPQLFEMTKSIHFCLQHTDDPIKWLYHYSTLRTISTYRDVDDYQKRWIALVKMEAALEAANNEESYVINNIPVLLDGKYGTFSVPVRYCQIRNIILDNMDHEINDDEQGDKHKKPIVNLAHDWLCIRSKMTYSTEMSNANNANIHNYCYWIAHGKITSAEIRRGKNTRNYNTQKIPEITQDENKKATVTVEFELHQTAPSIPSNTEEMCTIKCNIEILKKSTVDRRTESYIKILNGASRLAKAIALGKPIPRLDQKHLRASFLSEKEVPSLLLPANNKSQREAIDRTLDAAFSLIQGPPGSGKSYTAIKLIYLFSKINSEVKRKEQVLFCGPSNKSVDNVARWAKKLKDECPKIVRLYGRSIEALDYRIPGSHFTTKRSMRYLKADETLRDISVHHLIREDGKPFAEQIREFDRRFHNEKYIPGFEEVFEYMSLISKATVEELQHHEVIMCTTGVATSPKLLKGTKICQLIIDEAGMCTEPQCIAPIIANNAKQVILIGDHKQLRPIIKCKQAANLGMNKSLFERYTEDMKSTNRKENVKYSFLNKQYRMHPNLCEFPSKNFYNSKLDTAQEVFQREKKNPPLKLWPVPEKPHVLCHVEGSEEILIVRTEEGNEKSRSNPEEVKQVVMIFKYMVEEENINVKDINVISQYNAQCHALRKALEKENYKDFNVNTVVASQGGEWDYVLFSTVRSLPDHQIEPCPTLGWCTMNMGFIIDHHQINVALTRAKRGLIIVGNKKLLMCDEVWRSLVKQYEASKCVVSSMEFPPKSAATADIVPA